VGLPESLVTDFEPHIPFMTNHPKDRHVHAVAVHASASTIVTANLKHFPASALDPHSIAAQSPDDFLCSLLKPAAQAIAQVLRQLVIEYRSPPLSIDQLLASLAKNAPTFAERLPAHLLADQL
jgi:hypothetical protein